MIRSDWNPSEITNFEERWAHLSLPTDGVLLASDAARLQVGFSRMAEELGDLVAQALYYEETAKFRLKATRTSAWILSQFKTDKGREMDICNDPGVQLAEAKYIEAQAYRKLLENKYESAVRSHYSCKALISDAREREWLA